MIDVPREIKRLSKLTVGELRAEHERIAGEPLRSNNRLFLAKRVLWRLQANAYGGLTERCRARAAELARESDLRMRPTGDVHAAFASAVVTPGKAKASPAGSLIVKTYRGRRLEVHALESGFEYEGRVYRSLSAIASEITGVRWNGWVFFGLKNHRGAA